MSTSTRPLANPASALIRIFDHFSDAQQACNGCDIEQRTASHAGGRRAGTGAGKHALAG